MFSAVCCESKTDFVRRWRTYLTLDLISNLNCLDFARKLKTDMFPIKETRKKEEGSGEKKMVDLSIEEKMELLEKCINGRISQ